jgi:hypothetical protein
MIGLGISIVAQLKAGVSALSIYAVLGLEPALVFDFQQDYYRTGGTVTTFESAMTTTRASNATMIDADGLLKWAPHNLLTYSETLASPWTNVQGVSTITPDDISGPLSGTTATLVVPQATTLIHGRRISVAWQAGGYDAVFYVKPTATDINVEIFRNNAAGDFGNIGFNLTTLTPFAASAGMSGSVVAVADGFFKVTCSFSFAAAGTNVFDIRLTRSTTAKDQQFVGDAIEGIWLSAVHLYRSDLGGMVNNPDTGDSYVPTTTAARYLPRRGQHVYNGSAWVNEGMLVEPTASTNLLLNSDTLATQSVTVTAVPHTLHFTGNGTVTLSGAATGSLVGVGAGEQNRVNLTFTPTAGSLALTVTGSVTFADLTATPIPYSHIPTAGATATRAADVVTVPAANLPWPTPVETTGIELVTNGTFDTDTDWTKGTGWTISGGTANADGVTNADNLRQVITGLTIGQVCTLDFDLSNRTTGFLIATIRDAADTTTITQTANLGENGSYSLTFVATATSHMVRLISYISDFSADNISVKEINPLSVSIQLDGLMTYADTGSEVKMVRWYETSNDRVEEYLATSSTNVGQYRTLQVASGVADTVVGAFNDYTPGINVPFNIASRHGSTFINGAVDGTALTADLTPTSLPDLSTSDLQLASLGGPMIISKFRMWADDLTDVGIAEAST